MIQPEGELDEEQKTGFRDVLKNANYLRLWIGKNVSYMGTGVNRVALLWLILKMTGSPFDVGIMLICRSLPGIIFGTIVGALADRINRKLLIIAADIARGSLVLFIPFTHSIYQIYVLIFFIGLFEQLSTASRLSVLPNIVERKALLAANSLYQLTSMMAFIIGPALGGIIVGYIGITEALLFDAATYFFSAFFVLQIHLTEQERKIKERSLFGDIKDGFVYIRHSAIISYILTIFAVIMLSFGILNVLFVFYARDVLHVDAESFGLLLSCQAIGSLVGAAAVNNLAQKVRKSYLILGGILCLGILILLLSVVTSFYVALLIMVFLGIGSMTINIPSMTVAQEVVPDDMRGKMMGTASTLINTTSIISMGMGGIAGTYFNVQVIFFCCGVGVLLTGIMGRFIPQFKEIK
jgi:DHA3 family macrolide efflux protein-like MFS transporter